MANRKWTMDDTEAALVFVGWALMAGAAAGYAGINAGLFVIGFALAAPGTIRRIRT